MRALGVALLVLAHTVSAETTDSSEPGALTFAGETRLANVRQITFGGENAEAYFSHDGSELIFQSTRDALQCDAIFRMRADGTEVRQLSSGRGVTTCAFIAPDNRSIIYASTHREHEACPPKPDYTHGYVWPLYPEYDIFTAGPEGVANVIQRGEYLFRATRGFLGRFRRELVIARKRHRPHQTSAITRAGPPVPPRKLPAPTQQSRRPPSLKLRPP